MPVLVSRIIIVNIAIFLLACNTGTQGIIEVIVLEGTTDFQLMCPEVPKTVNIVSYKWFYNQDPIDRLRKNILSFDSVDRKESGIYACNIETTDVSYNYTYLLKVEYPPELLSFPSSVKFVHPNSSVSLECQCDGEPVPVVTWMKDGQPYRKGNKLRLTGNNTMPSGVESYFSIKSYDLIM
ncbi:inactive tyrosine-protein kinase 7-like [Saccoglossus kowalevskii]